jgi:predicted ATPase
VVAAAKSRLVGREDEQLALAAAMADARAGRPTTVLIEGEAGIGKTRLVAETADRLVGRDDVLLVGHGTDLAGGELPFGVITGALRDLVQRQGMETIRAISAEVGPSLGSLVPGLSDEPHQTDRLRILDAFATVITRISLERVTWVVVEDLQWADTSSRDALGYLLRVMAAPSRLMVTCTLRTQETTLAPALATFVDELVRMPSTRRMRLSRLDREHVAHQLHELLVQTPSRQFVDRVIALSDGVPFLTEELVAGGLSSQGPVPESVAELMLRRIHAMSSATQQLVQAASLGEGSLKHPLLATVCDVSPRELEDGVRAAVDGNILEVNDAKDGYRFHHALMREAVADELLPAVRARLHERWADALDAEGDRQIGGDAALTKIAAAHHWSETNNLDRAFETAVAAAGWAHSIGAEAERASLLTHVLDLWPHVPNAAVKAAGDRNDILEEVLAARSRSDQLNEALTLIEAQLRSDTHDADPVQRLHLHQLKAKYSNRLGRPDPGAEIGRREGIHLLLAAPSNAVFVRAVAGLIETDMGLVDVASSRQLLGRALDVADRIGRPLDTLALREPRSSICGCWVRENRQPR